MKEAIIRYDNPETFQVLKDIAKYFGFSISAKQTKKEKNNELEYINGIPYTRGNASIDIAGLTDVFTGKNISASTLRRNEWERRK